MIKGQLKRLLTWAKKNQDFTRSRHLRDRRVVETAIRMTRELAATAPRHSAIHPAADQSAEASAEIQAENNAEVDRIIAARGGLVVTPQKKVINFIGYGTA